MTEQPRNQVLAVVETAGHGTRQHSLRFGGLQCKQAVARHVDLRVQGHHPAAFPVVERCNGCKRGVAVAGTYHQGPPALLLEKVTCQARV
ncbi:hypothetical protein D9M70_569450 [compost metagenome]